MFEERGLISVSIVASTLFLLSILFLGGTASGVLAANVTLDFSITEQYADVLPNEYTLVQYEGVVSVEVVSLPANQVMEITLELRNDDIDHQFDPSGFVITQETEGEDLPFVLNVYADTSVQSGQNILEAYAFYRYSPGVMGGTSSTTELVLLVSEYKDGEVTGPGSVNVEEDSSGEVEITVMNTGNTWTEYDLLVEGTENGVSKGIEVVSEKVYDIDLHFGTSEVLPLGISVGDINGDTSIILTFTLLDHETGNEFSSHSVMVNAIQKGTPFIPDETDGGGGVEPIDDGEKSPPVPDNRDGGSEEDAEPMVQGSSSFSGTWIIIPVAVLLMLLGIGSYVWISTRKRG